LIRVAGVSVVAAVITAAVGLVSLTAQGAASDPIERGQKVVMATHSFNVFIGPNRRVPGDPGPLAKLEVNALAAAR
jgi:hypothetical protein